MSSIVLHDTICENDHVAINVACEKDAEGRPIFPPCDVDIEDVDPNDKFGPCGASTRAYYGAQAERTAEGHMDGHVQVFRPFVHDGHAFNTQEDFDRYKKACAVNLACDVSEIVVVPPDSEAEKKRKGEERQHRAWLGRKQSGFDDRDYERYKEEQRAIKAHRS